MITEDDARRTLEYDSYYVIQPEFPWWREEYSNGGKVLSEGFSYISNVNNQWLTVEELRELVKD
jgi:UDP-N-acetylglucosamine 4,6-dehydratase